MVWKPYKLRNIIWRKTQYLDVWAYRPSAVISIFLTWHQYWINLLLLWVIRSINIIRCWSAGGHGRTDTRVNICLSSRLLLTSSTLRLGIWKNDSNNLSLTWVCSSIKHSLIFLRTSMFSWEHIEPSDHVSEEVPSLLCSHNAMSPSLAAAIALLWRSFSVTTMLINNGVLKERTFWNIYLLQIFIGQEER